MEDENVDIILDGDGIGLMCLAVKNHAKDAKLVKQACIALASLVVDGE